MSPSTMKLVAKWATILLTLWTVYCVIPGPGLSLANSVVYVTLISHIALILTALGWYQSARVEEHQHEDNDVSEVVELLTNGS